MFPDDLHFRSKDRLDDLLKSFILKYFQTLPVKLSMRGQLILANNLSKHSKVNDEHYKFNEQLVVEAHGMGPLQSVSLFLGKVITNELRHGRVFLPRDGMPDRVVHHILALTCK